jgi:predicted secreted hydrolase
MQRRTLLLAPLALAALPLRADVVYPEVVRGAPLDFPRDHGSHPQFRTEWWYITGWLRDEADRDFGVQVTFFRTRPGVAEQSKSGFAPTQLVFAHAAIADPRAGALRHEQRAARAGFGLAQVSAATTDVAIDDWSLRLSGDTYTATVVAREFSFALTFTASGAPMRNGDGGVSRKGPRPAQASFYYSRPQLAAAGSLTLGERALAVRGNAWLDHEWSSEYLAPEAQGWDWTGINFDDGGALMAFRIRARDGSVLWAGGTLRDASGRVRALAPDEVRFDERKRWRSPRTGIDYPVAFRVQANGRTVELTPLIEDAELDSRASVGTVYWEGAVRVQEGGRAAGRGYLELTGYGSALRI